MSTALISTEELRAIIAEAVREQTGPLERHVHRLAGIVQSRLALPVDSLTVAQAAKRMQCSQKTIRRALTRGVFTDVRASRTNGSTWKILSDELDLFRLEGEDSVAAYRRQMGRE